MDQSITNSKPPTPSPAPRSSTLPAIVNPFEAQDAHELLLLLAWRKARMGRQIGWHYEFNLVVAGLPHVNTKLAIKDLLTRDELALLLATTKAAGTTSDEQPFPRK